MNKKLIGKVELLIAATEPGAVITEEASEVVLNTLCEVRLALKSQGRPPTSCLTLVEKERKV